MQAAFPFKLEDLKAWTIRRTDGTTTRFVLSNAPLVSHASFSKPTVEKETTTYNRKTTNLSGYCTHTPGMVPIATFAAAKNGKGRKAGDISMWIGNLSGAKSTKDGFNYMVDCGDIFTEYQSSAPDPVLSGDATLASLLQEYSEDQFHARILKIDWPDRAAAPMKPEFWPALNEQLSGDIMTCCVGGHGRSGTSFACLLLVNAPDYDAKDAIIHIRAVHCPRAIESQVQHDYIDKVAAFLGRKANAKEIEDIKDYTVAFAASTKPTAIRTRAELKEAEEASKK